jgi:hypothetical protein
MTCDQNHGYAAEEAAADHGAEDAYPANTGNNLTVDQCLSGFSYNGVPEVAPPGTGSDAAAMSYYDGNSVTGLWNYAQHFAMRDNAYGTTYGPSTPGALNVSSAQTYGAICGPSYATINDSPCPAPPGLNAANPALSDITAGPAQPAGPGTDFSDTDPTYEAAADAGYLPTVSYLKAPGYQDGHAGYSDPLDEQTWLADTIDQLESLPTWKSTAVIEYNWHLPALGNGAADAAAGSIADMFSFRSGPVNPRLFLNPATGEPISQGAWAAHYRPKSEVYPVK